MRPSALPPIQGNRGLNGLDTAFGGGLFISPAMAVRGSVLGALEKWYFCGFEVQINAKKGLSEKDVNPSKARTYR